MKLRYTLFCTFIPLFMDFRGSVRIFSVKGWCQNLEIQGAPFVIRPPQKFRGGWDPRPSYVFYVRTSAEGSEVLTFIALSKSDDIG